MNWELCSPTRFTYCTILHYTIP